LITLDGGSYFRDILEQLAKDDLYEIHWSKMNSKDYGIPQSRKRLYIVGIRKDLLQSTFTLPKEKKMKSLRTFVDTTDTQKIPIKEANKSLFENIPSNSLFIDVGFRKCTFPNSGRWAPCITAQPNMWCVPMQRKASVKEYLKLQGFPTSFKQPISDHQMKIKVGNSMTVDVIELLLERLFWSVGFIAE
jgi:DNA (cytosine-5)-methyltransferase 1